MCTFNRAQSKKKEENVVVAALRIVVAKKKFRALEKFSVLPLFAVRRRRSGNDLSAKTKQKNHIDLLFADIMTLYRSCYNRA